MQRKCKCCQQEKDLTEFASAGEINGVRYYRHLCVPCYSESKKPRKKELRDWFRSLKKQCKCSKCGNDDFRVLEFDHLDRNGKSFDLGESIRRGYSKTKILNEIEKCQVLCANCHNIVVYDCKPRLRGVTLSA